MRAGRPTLIIVSMGLFTFGAVFALLQVRGSDAAAELPATPLPPMVTQAPYVARADDSLAPRIAPGETALALPIGSAEPLLRDLQPGDRLDILANLPSPEDGRVTAAVVLRGATIVRPVSPGDPLLVQVPASEAIVVAHLILGGTRLSYMVWPVNASPPASRPLDEDTARALLGLPTASATRVVPATPSPTATPEGRIAAPPATLAQPEPPRPAGGFIYQAQPGDTWASVSSTFEMPEAELRAWNEAPPEAALDPGTLLFVPRPAS